MQENTNNYMEEANKDMKGKGNITSLLKGSFRK